MSGSGGGSPLWVADEFFERLSWLFDDFATFWGISSFALDELSDESDETDLDLKLKWSYEWRKLRICL